MRVLICQAVEELKSKHGIDRIDIVLANAGYYSNDQGFTNLSYEEAEKVWKVNVSLTRFLHGTVISNLTRLLGQALKEYFDLTQISIGCSALHTPAPAHAPALHLHRT